MPHQCTNCGHTFPDGSKEMLSGCPSCGSNKFQFIPAGSDEASASSDQSATQSTAESPSERSPAEPNPSTESTQPAAESTQPAANTPQSPSETEAIDDSGFVSKELTHTDESPAQSSARSDVVSSSELTAAGAAAPGVGDDTEPPTDQPAEADSSTDSTTPPAADQSVNELDQSVNESDQPVDESDQSVDESDGSESNLDELRQELNDQFESIRIVSPGQYELNLMELYDREEYIISLREDGRYVIEVPDGWGDS